MLKFEKQRMQLTSQLEFLYKQKVQIDSRSYTNTAYGSINICIQFGQLACTLIVCTKNSIYISSFKLFSVYNGLPIFRKKTYYFCKKDRQLLARGGAYK